MHTEDSSGDDSAAARRWESGKARAERKTRAAFTDDDFDLCVKVMVQQAKQGFTNRERDIALAEKVRGAFRVLCCWPPTVVAVVAISGKKLTNPVARATDLPDSAPTTRSTRGRVGSRTTAANSTRRSATTANTGRHGNSPRRTSAAAENNRDKRRRDRWFRATVERR